LRKQDRHRERIATPFFEVFAFPVVGYQERTGARIVGRIRGDHVCESLAGFAPEFNADLWIGYQIANPIRTLAASSHQVHQVALDGKPDLDSVR
jgi:hypothetical protein